MFGSFLLIGFLCGVLMMEYIEATVGVKNLFSDGIWSFVILFAGMYLGIFFQIVVHEAGHLVFGLATGYKFSSFRIGSLMWMKSGDGKIKTKRMKLAGTGGQCLMEPPPLVDGRIPYVMYNLGGSILNVVAAVLCFLLPLCLGTIPYVAPLCFMWGVIGVIFALLNGVPLRMGVIDNDGYNALSLGRDPEALRSFWVQMQANAGLAKGTPILDMPEEWFAPPADEKMTNSMIAVMGVFSCNRLMEERRFAEADARMKHYLTMDTGIVGLHKNLLVCDRIYCILMGASADTDMTPLYTKEQQKFMKAMGKFPTVLRTAYTVALLHDHDAKKAEDVKAAFEKMAKTYPYPSDTASERDLMERAAAKEKGTE